MTVPKRALLAIIGTIAFTAITAGQSDKSDWPQWRGPNRDGTLRAYVEPRSWPERLTQRWKIDIGTGYATPIVVGSRVATTEFAVLLRLSMPTAERSSGRRANRRRSR